MILWISSDLGFKNSVWYEFIQEKYGFHTINFREIRITVYAMHNGTNCNCRKL